MSFNEAFARLRICSTSSTASGVLQTSRCSRLARCNPTSLTSVRHATHGAQGRANGPKNGPGKRLGAKKTGEQYVIPGNIIYRQRGTLWFPGENVGMGRDHTIFSLQTGYVKYYKDPHKHPKRKYIGVVFDRNQSLPTPLNAARRRRLSMVAVPRTDLQEPSGLPQPVGNEIGVVPDPADPSGQGMSVVESADAGSKLSPAQQKAAQRLKASGRLPSEQLGLRPDYSYRESNYDIGRAAERAGVPKAFYKPNNRFVAWRKRTVRKQAAAEKRSMARKGGSKKKK